MTLLQAGEPLLHLVHGCHQSRTGLFDEIVTQFLFTVLFSGQRQSLSTVKVHKRETCGKVVRDKAEITGRQDGHTGIFQ